MCAYSSSGSSSSYTGKKKCDLSARGLSDLTDVEIPPVSVLILSKNQFTDLSSLHQNDELQVLQADYNKIEVLQPNNFEKCSSLTNLNLSYNLITKIPELRTLQSLQSLELAGNKIKVLENIEGMTKLTNLLLSRNEIHRVFLREQIPSLLKLNLRRNELNEINFGGCFPSLTSLHLDYCHLVSFSGLNEMKSLKKLTLSFNKINDSQPLNLPNLEYLNVSNNSLTNIQSFIKLTKLAVLDISFNPIDDQGISISTKFPNLVSLYATETHIIHPNLVLRFAPNVEILGLANTRVSQLQFAQTLVRKAPALQIIDFRGTPLTKDYYPSIEGQTIEAREEYESIEKYDSDYPETSVPRNQYRKSILGCVSSNSLKIFDGIQINTEEANIIRLVKDQKQKKNYEDEDESENEPYDTEISNSNRGNSKFNDTDELVTHLEKKNADLKSQKLYLQQESMLESIEQLLGEQDQLRAQLNLPPNDDINNQDDLHQYSLNQLAEYKQKIQEVNQSLIKKIQKSRKGNQIENDNNRNFNTSDVLDQERARNKSLRKELKKMREAHNQSLTNDDYTGNNANEVVTAIDELQQENQRLSREMIKAKNHHHRIHHSDTQNQSNTNQINSPTQKRRATPNKTNPIQESNSINRNNSNPAQQTNRNNRDNIDQNRHHRKTVRRNIRAEDSDANNRNNDYDDYNINKRPPDPSKIQLAEQLMAENALLRNTLGLDPLNYHPAESFSSADIDKIISQLLDHNKILREQVTQQSQLKNGVNKRPIPTQQMSRYLQYLDLQGSREGCTFWVPLDAKKQKEQQDYYNNMQMRLPIPVETNKDKRKKKQLKGCSKCEKAILMLSRVPLYPPDAAKIYEDSDEFQLVESWVITSLNRKVKISDVMKSSFFYRIIENERTMPNIHLFVVITNDALQYLTDGIDQPILLADHFKYVAKELKQSGSAQILICAFDVGNQATNYCEHRLIPKIQEMKSMNPSFDSLRFIYQDEEAIMALNPSRIVPIYSVQVSEIE